MLQIRHVWAGKLQKNLNIMHYHKFILVNSEIKMVPNLLTIYKLCNILRNNFCITLLALSLGWFLLIDVLFLNVQSHCGLW